MGVITRLRGILSLPRREKNSDLEEKIKKALSSYPQNREIKEILADMKEIINTKYPENKSEVLYLFFDLLKERVDIFAVEQFWLLLLTFQLNDSHLYTLRKIIENVAPDAIGWALAGYHLYLEQEMGEAWVERFLCPVKKGYIPPENQKSYFSRIFK